MTRSIAGETILVPVQNRVGALDSIYTLNDIGTVIWKALEAPSDIGCIASAIADEYEVPTEIAAGDVAEFLERLELTGLICRTEA